MTSATHRVFAIGWVLIGVLYMRVKGILEINYYLSMLIMLQFGKYGALFPDLDHGWRNVKEKTIPNLVVNKVIHMTGGRHRSWQTHSLDIGLLFTLIVNSLPSILNKYGLIDGVNKEVLWLILMGFSLGWLSHLFSDMLTSGGIRITCFSKIKIALVPRELLGFKFNTGHEWEKFVYKVTRVMNIVIGVVVVIFPYVYKI